MCVTWISPGSVDIWWFVQYDNSRSPHRRQPADTGIFDCAAAGYGKTAECITGSKSDVWIIHQDVLEDPCCDHTEASAVNHITRCGYNLCLCHWWNRSLSSLWTHYPQHGATYQPVKTTGRQVSRPEHPVSRSDGLPHIRSVQMNTLYQYFLTRTYRIILEHSTTMWLTQQNEVGSHPCFHSLLPLLMW